MVRPIHMPTPDERSVTILTRKDVVCPLFAVGT